MFKAVFTLAIVLLASILSVSAQNWDDANFNNFTYDEANYPMPGDTIVSYFIIPMDIDIENVLNVSGEDVEWDFVSLLENAELDSVVTSYHSFESETADILYSQLTDQEEFLAAFDTLVKNYVFVDESGNVVDPAIEHFLIKEEAYYEAGEVAYATWYYQAWLQDSEDETLEILCNFCQVYYDGATTETLAFEKPEMDFSPEELEAQIGGDTSDNDYTFDWESLDTDEDGNDDTYLFGVSEKELDIDGIGDIIVPDFEDENYVYYYPSVRLVESTFTEYYATYDIETAEVIYWTLEDQYDYLTEEGYIEGYDYLYIGAGTEPLKTFTWYGFFVNENDELDFGELASFQGYDEQALEDVFSGKKSASPSKKGLSVGKIAGNKQSSGIRMLKSDVISDLQVYPNPTSEIINMDYSVSKAGKYTIDVIDIKGSVVKSGINVSNTIGANTAQISASDLNSGIYQIVLKRDGVFSASKPVVVE